MGGAFASEIRLIFPFCDDDQIFRRNGESKEIRRIRTTRRKKL